MLVLSRKKDESILLKIDGMDDIALTVVRIENGRVRLGIEASGDVTIVRSELQEREMINPLVVR